MCRGSWFEVHFAFHPGPSTESPVTMAAGVVSGSRVDSIIKQVVANGHEVPEEKLAVLRRMYGGQMNEATFDQLLRSTTKVRSWDYVAEEVRCRTFSAVVECG